MTLTAAAKRQKMPQQEIASKQIRQPGPDEQSNRLQVRMHHGHARWDQIPELSKGESQALQHERAALLVVRGTHARILNRGQT